MKGVLSLALKEQDIVFTGQDTSGNTVIQMPITRLENVEGLSDELLKCVRSVNGISVDNTGGVSISNVASADRLSSARTISLTNDVTGSTNFDGSGNASITTTLANSGVTAGSYGPSANVTPAQGATFDVPYITVDAKGRLTAASTKTVKMPSGSVPTASSSTMGGIKPASAWVKLLSGTSKSSYSYTATKNCFVCAYNSGGTNNMTVQAAIGGVTIYRDYGHHNDGNNSYPMMYLSKGQTITLTQNSSALHFSVLDLE